MTIRRLIVLGVAVVPVMIAAGTAGAIPKPLDNIGVVIRDCLAMTDPGRQARIN